MPQATLIGSAALSEHSPTTHNRPYETYEFRRHNNYDRIEKWLPASRAHEGVHLIVSLQVKLFSASSLLHVVQNTCPSGDDRCSLHTRRDWSSKGFESRHPSLGSRGPTPC